MVVQVIIVVSVILYVQFLPVVLMMIAASVFLYVQFLPVVQVIIVAVVILYVMELAALITDIDCRADPPAETIQEMFLTFKNLCTI